MSTVQATPDRPAVSPPKARPEPAGLDLIYAHEGRRARIIFCLSCNRVRPGEGVCCYWCGTK